MRLRTYGTLLMTFFTGSVMAQTNDALFKDSGWSAHFQFTGIVQAYPSFSAPYTGQNSLQPNGEHAYSVTTTAYLGHSLWKGASIFWNPEMAEADQREREKKERDNSG